MLKLCITLLLNMAVGCSSQGDIYAVNRDAFFVSPGATDIVSDQNGRRLGYVIHEPFPAERFFQNLREHLKARGWNEMDELLTFPGRRTSDIPNGWSEYLEKDEMVRLSARNWIGPNREAVTYIIRYAIKRGQSLDDAQSARVQASFMTAIEADELRSKIKKGQD